MNFRSRRQPEEPEINFIPLIDLLLVILIFLMVTTTYNRSNGFDVRLPDANAPLQAADPTHLILTVTDTAWQLADKHYSDREALITALKQAQQTDTEARIIIRADNRADYQRVIDTLQATQSAGLTHITLSTQPTARVP